MEEKQGMGVLDGLDVHWGDDDEESTRLPPSEAFEAPPPAPPRARPPAVGMPPRTDGGSFAAAPYRQPQAQMHQHQQAPLHTQSSPPVGVPQRQVSSFAAEPLQKQHHAPLQPLCREPGTPNRSDYSGVPRSYSRPASGRALDLSGTWEYDHAYNRAHFESHVNLLIAMGSSADAARRTATTMDAHDITLAIRHTADRCEIECTLSRNGVVVFKRATVLVLDWKWQKSTDSSGHLTDCRAQNAGHVLVSETSTWDPTPQPLPQTQATSGPRHLGTERDEYSLKDPLTLGKLTVFSKDGIARVERRCEFKRRGEPPAHLVRSIPAAAAGEAPASTIGGAAGSSVAVAATSPPGSARAVIQQQLRHPPHAEARACAICGLVFSTIFRKHRCRSCNGAFCDEHSKARLPRSPDEKDLVRMCDVCAQPAIERVSVVGSAGGRVKLTGRNLGSLRQAQAGLTTVTVANGSPAETRPLKVPGVEHFSLSFVVPPGIGRRGACVCVPGRAPCAFELVCAAPELTAVGAADTEGGPVFLRGSNLGDAAALAAGHLRLWMDDAPLLVEAVSKPHTEWQVTVPPGIGTGHELIAEVGGITSGPLLYSYAAPAVLAVRRSSEAVAPTTPSTSPLPAHAEPAAFQEVLYVYGTGFGPKDSEPVVRVLGERCSARVVLAHAKLRVHLSPEALAALLLARGGGAAPRIADVAVVVGDVPSGRA